jgi:NAD(P)-dependent dehydrogenase (short-subunit alcohol dehydrogenase family)
MTTSLNARTLVVGASAGIGRAIADRLAESGASVVLTGRREAKLNEAVAQITSSGGAAYAIAADICDPSQCDRLVGEAVGFLGGLDMVVVAASAARLMLLADTTGDDWLTIMRTNVIGPALIARAALPHLPADSLVAFLSSESVGGPYHGLGPYTTSKAALEESIRAWRVEHPDIRFCCVTVGATDDTDFSRDFDMELAGRLLPEWISRGKLPAKFMKSAPLGAAIADTLSTVLASPGVSCEQITLRAPGGPMQGGVDSLLETIKETSAG